MSVPVSHISVREIVQASDPITVASSIWLSERVGVNLHFKIASLVARLSLESRLGLEDVNG
jgi:hypothetical protein